jgi:PAS domain S-box-containing protein
MKEFIKKYTSAIFSVFWVFLSVLLILFFLFTETNRDPHHLAVYGVYFILYFIIGLFIRYLFAKLFREKEKFKGIVEVTKEAELKVKLSEEKYLDLLENTPLCIKVFDENMKMIFLNKGGREEHHIKDTDDISKWDWVGTVKEQYQAEAKEKFQNAFTKGEASTIEFEHTPEGSTHEWCSSLISPIKNKEGKVKSVLFLSNDITALKKAELEAKQNERMFRALLDATPLCIKWFDGKGNLISINKGGREEHHLEKLSDEEVKNWDYWTCIEKDYHAMIKEKMGLALKGEEGSFLMKHIPGTAKGIWCESSLVPVKNEKGEVNYILFLSRDVTSEKSIEEERKKNQERSEETKTALFNILEDVKESEINLKEERDKSQAIISSMGEGLLVVDKNYKIILMNKKAEELLETSIDKAIGKSWQGMVAVFKKEQELAERPIEETFKTGKTVVVGLEDDIYYKLPSGKKFPVEIITTSLGSEENVTAGIIVFRDITNEKSLNEAQKSFISIASHQLRTPLTSIRWYAEMLASEDAGSLNKDQKEFVSRVYSGALKLNEVINLLLSLARIESGKTEMEMKKVSLIPFTEDVIKELDPLFKQKGLKTEIIMKEKDLPEVDFDASMLRQIVTNLLSNSIRYTNDNGVIQVIIEKKPGEIVYSVKDDGIGIPENQRSKIFGKFFRAENAMSKVPDGSGLGLSLVKALVEMNKGAIWFETPASWVDEAGKEEKKGTVFHFTIPLKVG